MIRQEMETACTQLFCIALVRMVVMLAKICGLMCVSFFSTIAMTKSVSTIRVLFANQWCTIWVI
jgi:hypothetical protein